jgi:predicted MFS family arabinose efflux permease
MYGAMEETIGSEQGRFYGAFESWGGTTLTAMLIITGILLGSIAWTGVLRLVAIPGFVAGIIFLRARPPAPRTRTVTSEAADGEAVVGRGILAAFLASNMLRFVTMTGVIAFVPTFFVHQVGLEPDVASYATALFFGGGIIGTRLGGRLGDRFPPLGVLLVALAFGGPLVFLLGLISSPVLLGVVLFAFGLTSMLCLPAQNLALTKLAPHLGGGEAFGILMGAMTMTQALSPAAFGAAADAIGLAATVRLFAAPTVLSWVVLFLMTRARSVRHLVSTKHGGKDEGTRSYGTV